MVKGRGANERGGNINSQVVYKSFLCLAGVGGRITKGVGRKKAESGLKKNAGGR